MEPDGTILVKNHTSSKYIVIKDVQICSLKVEEGINKYIFKKQINKYIFIYI